MSLLSPESVADNAISEAVARFAISECERLLGEYRSGGLTVSEALLSLGGAAALGCRVILRGSADWHEGRAG